MTDTLADEIFAAQNDIRQNPGQWVAKLEAYKAKFLTGNDAKKVVLNGVTYVTQEGTAAVDEAIAFLRDQTAIAALTRQTGMDLASKRHVDDQGPRGGTGHYGADGSSPWDRMSMFGQWKITAGENIEYGSSTGE